MTLPLNRCKVVSVLISWALYHKDIWGSGGIAPPFLISALEGGELSVSRTLPLYPLDKKIWTEIKYAKTPNPQNTRTNIMIEIYKTLLEAKHPD
jgi:hypothetical protein